MGGGGGGRLPSDLLVKIFTDSSNSDKVRMPQLPHVSVIRLLGSCKTMYSEDVQLTHKLAMGIARAAAEGVVEVHNNVDSLMFILKKLPTPASMKLIKQTIENSQEESQNKTSLCISNEPVSVTKMLLDLDLAPKVHFWLILGEISIEKFKLLLTHPKAPDINSFIYHDGGNILHFFVRNYHYFPDRNLQIARLLLKHGIDYKKRDYAGLTPLEHAHALQAEGMITLLQRYEHPEKSDCMEIM